MNTINIPVLALRGMTAFPGETVSFDVEREISIFALDNAMEGDRRLFLVTQRKIGVSEPEEQDLYEIGTVCHVLQIIKTSETTVRVLVEGEQRARLHRLWQTSPFLQANVELVFQPEALDAVADQAIQRNIGARGLRAVMEGLLTKIMYEIPSDPTITRVTITPGAVLKTGEPEITRDPQRTERPGRTRDGKVEHDSSAPAS